MMSSSISGSSSLPLRGFQKDRLDSFGLHYKNHTNNNNNNIRRQDKVLCAQGPVDEGQGKEIEEHREVESTVHHDSDTIHPHHIAGLPWLVPKVELSQ